MKKLVHILQSNKITLTLIVLFILLISFQLKLLIVPIIIFVAKYSKRINTKLLVILVVIFSLIYLYVNNIKIPKYIDGYYCIINKKSYDYSNLYTIKKGFKSYQVFIKEDYLVGQFLKVSGNVNQFDSTRIPGGFNQYQYYLSKGILGQVDLISYQVTKYSNPLYKFSAINITDSNLYLSLFFGNGMDLLLDKKNLEYLNIIHYFSLSGLHIYLIFQLVSILIYNLNLSSNAYSISKIIISTIFYFFSTFSLSILRIMLYEILKYINKKYNLKINNFILLNLTFIIMILMSPFNIINSNFLIMYLIVSGIILLKPLYNNDNFLIKSIKISFITTLIVLPFSQKVNIVGVLFAPLFILVICYLIFPLSILTIFTNRLNSLLTIIIDLLNSLVDLFSNQSILIVIPKINNYLIIFYFVLLLSLLYIGKKYYVLIIPFIVLILYLPIVSKPFKCSKLVFLDVGQGDSAVYLSNSLNIVIDTFDGTVDYLLNEGVRVVDYLILTHSDLDHIKEANLLINKLKVNTIIINPYDRYDLKYSNNTKLIKVYDDLKITKNDLSVQFFSSSFNYFNSNNNSLVFKLSFDNNDVLFTGDIEKERELELIDKYNYKLESKYLKVAHHGSNTSSSNEFINYVNPTYAIISVSKTNRYQLPSLEVVNRFKYNGIVVYQTKDSKTIKIMNQKVVFMQ